MQKTPNQAAQDFVDLCDRLKIIAPFVGTALGNTNDAHEAIRAGSRVINFTREQTQQLVEDMRQMHVYLKHIPLGMVLTHLYSRSVEEPEDGLEGFAP